MRSLWLPSDVDIPQDLYRFYAPEAYYSVRRDPPLKRFLIERRTQFLAGDSPFLGRIISSIFPPEKGLWPPFRGLSLTPRILEIGCGRGVFLRKLFERGYRNLTGIDPYLSPKDQRYKPFQLIRCGLADLPPAKYDLLLFDHSFEHLERPRETLEKARDLIADDGTCMLRIPFVDSYAWEHYGVNWVQLDAPRHLYLYSAKSLGVLSAQTRWRIEDIVHDSYCLQFYGSEQIVQDIPLRAPRSWHVNTRNSLFSSADIAAFEEQARQLNEQGRGDQVTVYLRPTLGD